VDLCGEDNADTKSQCLGKGHTMLTKQPRQTEFQECWSETIIKNGLSLSLVDFDGPLFRKALVEVTNEESWRYPHVRWMAIYNQSARHQCDS
jgi:hypothetical protein